MKLQIAAVFGLGGSEMIVLIIAASLAFLWSKIAKQAGYSALWGLAVFVPIVNVILFFYFAFAKWPSVQGATVKVRNKEGS